VQSPCNLPIKNYTEIYHANYKVNIGPIQRKTSLIRYTPKEKNSWPEACVHCHEIQVDVFLLYAETPAVLTAGRALYVAREYR
jgi:hypothetical protein